MTSAGRVITVPKLPSLQTQGLKHHLQISHGFESYSRFNRIAWGSPINGRSKGILAAGMENGELGLWDPEKILTTSE